MRGESKATTSLGRIGMTTACCKAATAEINASAATNSLERATVSTGVTGTFMSWFSPWPER